MNDKFKVYVCERCGRFIESAVIQNIYKDDIIVDSKYCCCCCCCVEEESIDKS